jgi:hypothetical protein
MIITRYICLLAVLLVTTDVLPEEFIVDNYTPGLDQEVIDVLPADAGSSAPFILVKEYLAEGKSKLNPSQREYQNYKIVQASNHQMTTVFKASSSDDIKYGKSLRLESEHNGVGAHFSLI